MRVSKTRSTFLFVILLLLALAFLNLLLGLHIGSSVEDAEGSALESENHMLRLALVKSNLELEASASAVRQAERVINEAQSMIDQWTPDPHIDRKSGRSNLRLDSITSRELLNPALGKHDSVHFAQPSDGKLHTESSLPSLFDDPTAVVMFCYGRPHYLQKTVDSLLSALKTQVQVLASRGQLLSNSVIGKGLYFIFSQDGKNSEVTKILGNTVSRIEMEIGVPAFVLHHPQGRKVPNAYYKLADHFRWGLNAAFKHISTEESFNPAATITSVLSSASAAKQVIVLEDDMLFSPDFFEYMGSMKPILQRDTQLLAVSAWNDHGQRDFVHDRKALLRSDFFPGLGWMLRKDIWVELEAKWPEAYWDDWLREPVQRKGRQVIHPEVCRTYTIGELGGASAGQFYSAHLKPIFLNDEFVHFTLMDLSSLELDQFQKDFMSQVRESVEMTISEARIETQHAKENSGSLKPNPAISPSWRFRYADEKSYSRLCRAFGLIDDVRGGTPRGAFKGIVPFWYKDRKVFLVPTSIALH